MTKSFLINYIIFLALIFVSCSVNKHIGSKSKQILSIIGDVEKNPTDTSQIRKEHVWILLEYMQNPGVKFVISETATPWLTKNGLKWGTALMASFFAGCIRNEINQGDILLNNYEGAILAMSTYKEIKRIDSTFRFDGLENFINLEAKGTLKELLRNYVKSKY